MSFRPQQYQPTCLLPSPPCLPFGTNRPFARSLFLGSAHHPATNRMFNCPSRSLRVSPSQGCIVFLVGQVPSHSFLGLVSTSVSIRPPREVLQAIGFVVLLGLPQVLVLGLSILGFGMLLSRLRTLLPPSLEMPAFFAVLPLGLRRCLGSSRSANPGLVLPQPPAATVYCQLAASLAIVTFSASALRISVQRYRSFMEVSDTACLTLASDEHPWVAWCASHLCAFCATGGRLCASPFLQPVIFLARAANCDRPLLVWTGTRFPARKSRRRRPSVSPGWLPFLCQVLLGHSLPLSVWAAPGGAEGAAALTASLATHGPVSHLSDSAALSPALSSTGVPLSGVPANVIDVAQLAADSADPNLHCLVFAAGYRTEHLVLDVPCDITADALVARVQVASALVQRLSPAHLFPAHPQPGQGYASFVVVPDWVPADRRQVVLLDFARMRGPVFAHVFHNPLTYRDLVTEAVAQTDELWHAYIPNSFEPLAVGCEVTLSSGDVISFSPRDVPLARDSDLTLLLSRPSSWQREPDHILLERPTSAWLVILPQSVQSFPFYGTFTADLQQAIADHMDSQVQHISFGHPTEPLTDVVHRGRLFDKIAAADHRSENLPPGPNLGAFVFLDARQSARGLGFLFEGHGAVVPTQDGVRVLGLRPPRGFRTYAEHVFLRREGLPVVDGCVLVLGYEFDEDTVGTVPAAAAPGAIASVTDERLDSAPSGAAGEAASPSLGPAPPPHIGFLVLSPRVAPITLEIPLEIPCSPQHACETLASQLRTNLATTYEHLVVAQPQPDRRFCTFIALPLWATHVVCVVVDARAVDGRLFAMHLDSGLFPRSILVQISLRPSLGFRVMHNDYVHQAQEAIFLSKGDVLFILPARAAAPTPPRLPDMLYQLDGWHLPVPDFKGFLQTPFYLLTDAWNTVADFPASASTSYAALRQFAIAFLRYEDHRSSLQTLHPRVADYNFHGIVCRAVLIATEQPIGPPVPPARARPPCIAYAIDRRAVLADITWHITPTGRVDLDALMREFNQHRPVSILPSQAVCQNAKAPGPSCVSTMARC
ncbi:GWD2 [Symbiodinium sp. CCMP2592]|nr:GWD2 [Symbiodinium sp. CCMP2592]